MVNHFATISTLENSDFYSNDSSLVKIDWNWDNVGAHLNEQYWYKDDFMSYFTLLIALQKNNNSHTIFFNDDFNADEQI